jgi:hypothetical protein
VSRSERRSGTPVLRQIVVSEHDDDGLANLIVRDCAQHPKSGALPQMQVQQHHIHRLALQYGNGICFAIDRSGQLHAWHTQQSLAQPFSQNARILD